MIRKTFKPFNVEMSSEDSVCETRMSDNVDSAVNDNENLSEKSEPERKGIKFWAEEDRPREKLMAKGCSSLTNAELLAILIGSGTPNKSAVELTQEILRHCGNRLANLGKMSIKELMTFNGIGEAKAITIVAAAEIGRRRSQEQAADMPKMSQPDFVYEFMRPRVQDLTHEESWVMLLNNDARLIKFVHLSSGGLTDTSVDVRILLKEALLADATCFILVHNHPSGSLRPSAEDIKLTEYVRRAGDTMKIRLLDHVIVTDGGYYSFVNEGKL